MSPEADKWRHHSPTYIGIVIFRFDTNSTLLHKYRPGYQRQPYLHTFNLFTRWRHYKTWIWKCGQIFSFSSHWATPCSDHSGIWRQREDHLWFAVACQTFPRSDSVSFIQVICWEAGVWLPAVNNFCRSFLSSVVLLSSTYFPFIRSLSSCILFLPLVAFASFLNSLDYIMR